ncbi:hypothetical protein ACHAXS_013759, partial [Conticribra weissflogii]
GDLSCKGNKNSIGDLSCVGLNACEENSFNILEEACLGDYACADPNSAVDGTYTINSSSCHGFYACSTLEANVGINS